LVVSQEEELESAARAHSIDPQDQDEERTRQKMLELVGTQKKLLGKPCQGLLDLRDGQEKSYAQMADVLKVPIGTIMSRLARCKETLKTLVLKALKGSTDGR
jgi:DNA-directed RNA polymerase specialized sigma24 family protein